MSFNQMKVQEKRVNVLAAVWHPAMVKHLVKGIKVKMLVLVKAQELALKVVKHHYSNACQKEVSQTLLEARVISKEKSGVKVLGNGTVEKKLTVKAHKFSTAAKEAIEAVGGKTEVI